MALLHREVEVSEYVTGVMTGRRRAALEAHLARCAGCRELLAETRRKLSRRASLAGDTGQVPTVTAAVPVSAALAAPHDPAAVAVAAPALPLAPVLLGTSRRRVLSSAVPVVGSIVTVLAFVAVLVAAWNAGGRAQAADIVEPTSTFTSDGTPLNGMQVQDLRRAGWTVPDLADFGLRSTSSTGTLNGNQATVRSTYQAGNAVVVVNETRNLLDPTTVTPVGESTVGAYTSQGDALTVKLRTDGADVVLISSLSQSETEAVVARLVEISDDRAEDRNAAETGGFERLSRGFSRLVDPAR